MSAFVGIVVLVLLLLAMGVLVALEKSHDYVGRYVTLDVPPWIAIGVLCSILVVLKVWEVVRGKCRPSEKASTSDPGDYKMGR